MPEGFGASFTYNFQKYFGLEGDFGHNWDNYETTISAGPKATYRTENANYFCEYFVELQPPGCERPANGNGIGAILGGGMDLKITHLFYLRLFEADYVWARQNYSQVVSSAFPDLRRVSLEGVRLRTGLVFNFGYPPAVTPTASCSVQPSEVMQGEPITATASGANFNPKHPLTYTWSGTGGKVTGKDNTASIDTNGVAGGSYTVSAHITDPKMKTGGEATCTANYTVKEPPKNPPTNVLLGQPKLLAGGWKLHHHLQLHQPGQCSGHGSGMDRNRWKRFRQRQHRNPEYHRCICRTGHGERNLYGFAWPKYPSLDSGQR